MQDVIASPIPPPTPYTSWCDYAQAGLKNALDGFFEVSAGTQGYGIGSRNVSFRSPAEQATAVDIWQRMVDRYCGTCTASITGRDSAVRIIPSDV